MGASPGVKLEEVSKVSKVGGRDGGQRTDDGGRTRRAEDGGQRTEDSTLNTEHSHYPRRRSKDQR